ncbi:MAG: type II toxin-antitoxin system YafQ family toxin [Alphaproteobacteria bacterium]|nr:type II toxin-antitoxin system YafQ family toxin [Alphaproteobacteria bacterium]
MREIERTRQFKRDLKLARKRRKKLDRLQVIIELLANDMPLSARHRPHRLIGDMDGYWECHVEPDYLLVYEYLPDTLMLVRLGTHSDLF